MTDKDAFITQLQEEIRRLRERDRTSRTQIPAMCRSPLDRLTLSDISVNGYKVDNTRREVEIATIDIVPGRRDNGDIANRAAPAVIAITTGTILAWPAALRPTVNRT